MSEIFFVVFPLQQSDELIFEILSNPFQQGQISQDLIMDKYATPNYSPFLRATIHRPWKKKKLSIRVLGRNNNSSDEITDELKHKKIMHRYMKHQRKQGIAALHSSL